MQRTPLVAKDVRYYNFEKTRIAALIPEGPHRILDIGCAAGRLGQKLREQNKVAELIGVEICETPASEAAKHYDKVYVEDVEHLNFPCEEYFDYVVCGDILEHLRDPWTTLDRINRLLKPEGILLVSIPNIRYWRILRDLVIFGRWEYVDAGILDNTHLRFFTRRSFLDMLVRAHFEIAFYEFWVDGKKHELVNQVTCGVFREFLGSPLVVKAVKSKTIDVGAER